MIIRITFLDEKNEQYQMLFGNSYKKWQDQVFEYIYRCFCSRGKGANLPEMLDHIEKVEVSKTQWIGWGGLKWSSHDNFQQELNREGCQHGEQDNPKPRKYSDMKFIEEDVEYVEKIIRKEF